MNKKLKFFLQIGKGITEVLVPGIATVEEAVTTLKNGKDKKKAVLALTRGTIDTLSTLGFDKIKDREMFDAGLSEINDGYVKILNSLKDE